MIKHMRLSYDALIGLLHGKEVHIIIGDDELVINPPFDGVFLTHEELNEIKLESEMGVIRVLQKIRSEDYRDYTVASDDSNGLY